MVTDISKNRKQFDPKFKVDYNCGCYGQLDCLVNNAGMIDYEAPNKPTIIGEDRWELTMMVNCIAPLFITYKLLTEYGGMQRVVTTTSSAMSDMAPKLANVKSVPFISNHPWSPWKQY